MCPESLPAAGLKGPGAIRPREPPPRSLHLNYRNDCVIISRALVSSRQGSYMVHAARAAAVSAPAALSPRHPLIDVTAIRNAGNSRENNELNFSNRPKNACSGAHSAPKKSPITTQKPAIVSAPAPLSTRRFLIASHQHIKNRANPLKTNDKIFSNR